MKKNDLDPCIYHFFTMNKILDQLPGISPKHLAIKLKPAGERALRRNHPWVFEGSIVKQSSEGQPGDLAIIYGQKKNKLMAIGLYDPYSPIRIKVLSHQATQINPEWFTQQIVKAKAKRQPLFTTDTNSYRLIYGENDGLPGLIVDVYAEVLVVKLYSLIWLPYLKALLPALLNTSECEVAVLRLSRLLQSNPEQLYGLVDGLLLKGQLKQTEVQFREHGRIFSADVIKGHKTGFFLDHRHNRKRIGALAKNKRVLDVFSYAGGFTVHALAGHAKEVYSLDISAQAQQMAKHNVQLNLEQAQHHIIVADAFQAMQRLYQKKESFDLIIVDPPSFAKQDSEREGALSSYRRLTALALKLVRKGGILFLASCSSRITAAVFFETIEEVLASSGRQFHLMEKTFHDVDHPVGFPEGAYLKGGYYEIQ
jgi:23S rRNA (cytosine1962-C5)-methyltransferase